MLARDSETLRNPAAIAQTGNVRIGGKLESHHCVLHVINGLFFGGGHRSTCLLIDALNESAEIDARLGTLGDCAESPVSARRDFVVPYRGPYNNPAVLFGAARRLRRLVKAQSVNILHTHGLDAHLIGGLAVQGLSTRHICHLRITPPLGKQESWKADVRKRLFRFLTRRSWFIAVSDAVRVQMAEYYGLSLERIITVRNGVDFNDFGRVADSQRKRNERVVFGTAARLAPMKGLEHLIEAAGAMRDQGIDFELRIAGTGNQRQALEGLAESLSLGDRIRFVGHISQMKSYYEDLDVFVLPSVSTEGLPLVVLESMAMGLPVVATRVGGTPEALRDGVDGVLVEPGDVAGLAAAMSKLAADPGLRATMGESGHQRVKTDFCMERVGREVMDVYRRVLNEG